VDDDPLAGDQGLSIPKDVLDDLPTSFRQVFWDWCCCADLVAPPPPALMLVVDNVAVAAEVRVEIVPSAHRDVGADVAVDVALARVDAFCVGMVRAVTAVGVAFAVALAVAAAVVPALAIVDSIDVAAAVVGMFIGRASSSLLNLDCAAQVLVDGNRPHGPGKGLDCGMS